MEYAQRHVALAIKQRPASHHCVPVGRWPLAILQCRRDLGDAWQLVIIVQTRIDRDLAPSLGSLEEDVARPIAAPKSDTQGGRNLF
jgi:hypothetical protein